MWVKGRQQSLVSAVGRKTGVASFRLGIRTMLEPVSQSSLQVLPRCIRVCDQWMWHRLLVGMGSGVPGQGSPYRRLLKW